jgi:hypothetical protein
MVTKSTQCCNIPVPKGADFSGEFADQLARFAFQLMQMTVTSEKRRDYGYYIPFSCAYGRSLFGGHWDKIRRRAATDYSHVFDFNDRYSNFDGNKFPKSVRLRDEYRTGEVELYALKRKIRLPCPLDEDYGAVGNKLVADFYRFKLPDEAPEFDNFWQAYTWERIRSQHFYAGYCDFGRFHSNFTAFKHRYLLQHKLGYPLSAIDITACQPLCLGAVLLAAYGDRPDIRHWIALCQESDLYAELGALMGLSVTPEIRDQVKNGFVRMLFERTHKMEQMDEFHVLEKHFPSFASYLTCAKQSKGYQTVAHSCQRFESDLLIQKVVPHLDKTNIITIHDEIILPSKEVGRATKAMQKEFGKFGLNPKLKEKIL